MNTEDYISLKYHPQILQTNGQKQFVIFTYEAFLNIQEELENYRDIQILDEVKQKEGHLPSITLNEAKKQLGIN
jgi:hypothetical protein